MIYAVVHIIRLLCTDNYTGLPETAGSVLCGGALSGGSYRDGLWCDRGEHYLASCIIQTAVLGLLTAWC